MDAGEFPSEERKCRGGGPSFCISALRRAGSCSLLDEYEVKNGGKKLKAVSVYLT